jgi:hypothetical protein
MMERYTVTFLDVKVSSEPLRPGETPEQRRQLGARMVTVEGEAPSRFAANLLAWRWLEAQEAPRLVFPGEYVLYAEARLRVR